MSSNPSTILTRLMQERARCAARAAEANQFLAENGRPPVSIAPAGKLRFAVMGQFDAGKSTLVNALLGEKRAETGPTPTTRRVHAYDFRDFRILDVPGSDARDREQDEALRALDEVPILLYVVSSQTGLDCQTLWKDLNDLEKRGVLFLVVVNDNQPHSSTDEEREFQEKLFANFCRQATAQLRNATPSLYWVNARRAEQGRLENKVSLVHRSGIVPLEDALVELLSSNDQFLQEVPHLPELLKALSAVEKEFARKLATDEAQALNAALEQTETVRAKLADTAEVIANEFFAPLRRTVGGRLSRTLTGSSTDQANAADEATQLLEETFNRALTEFERHCQTEFLALSIGLRGQGLAGKELPRDGLQMQLGTIPSVGGTGEIKFDNVLSRLCTAAPGILQLTEGLGGGATRALVPKAGKAATQAVARESGQVFGRVLGPVLIGLVAAWEIYQGFRKAAEEQQMIEAALRELDAKADLAITSCRHQFLGRVNNFVVTELAPVTRALQGELRARAEEQSDATGALARASELREGLESAILALNTRTRE